MKTKRLILGLLSAIVLAGVAADANAWHCWHRRQDKFSATITCRPYNAFSPTCYGCLEFSGCWPFGQNNCCPSPCPSPCCDSLGSCDVVGMSSYPLPAYPNTTWPAPPMPPGYTPPPPTPAPNSAYLQTGYRPGYAPNYGQPYGYPTWGYPSYGYPAPAYYPMPQIPAPNYWYGR